MLSPELRWQDIDRTQWTNLWGMLHAPDRRAHQLYALLDVGTPVALVDSHHGQVALTEWPTDAPTPHAAATRLRERFGVDRVIMAELDVLESIWEAQQRAYSPDLDYDDYLDLCRGIATRTLAEHTIASPDQPPPTGPHLMHGDLAVLFGDTPITGSGSFLITVFDGTELWWSVAGRVTDGKIDLLTSSLGLLPTQPATPAWPTPVTDPVEPLELHRQLATAAEAQLGPLILSHRLTREEFAALILPRHRRSAVDPPGECEASGGTRRA